MQGATAVKDNVDRNGHQLPLGHLLSDVPSHLLFSLCMVKILKIAVIILILEQYHFTTEKWVQTMQTEWQTV